MSTLTTTAPATHHHNLASQFPNVRRQSLALVDEAEEKMLGADEFVSEQAGLLLGQVEDAACPVREALEHSRQLATPSAPGAAPPIGR